MASGRLTAGIPGPADRRWLVGLALAAVAFATTLEPGLSNDAWWHLALGRWTLGEGAIPRVDPFPTLREGTYWVRSGWLADVGMYALYREGGQASLRLVTSAIVAITTLGLWWRSRGALVTRVAVVGTAMLALNTAAVPRPLVVALPLLLVTEAILARERSSPTRWVWALPMLAGLWANLHGTFVLIPGLLTLDVVAMLADRDSRSLGRARRLCGVLVVTILATLLNPFGWRILSYPLEVGRLTALGSIEEWQPTLTVFPESLLYGVIVATVGWVAWRQRHRLDLADLVRLAVFAVASAMAVRHVALLAVVAVPIVAKAVDGRAGVATPDDGPTSSRSSWEAVADAGLLAATVATAVATAVVTTSSVAMNHATVVSFPVDAATAVEEVAAAGSRVYHPYGWGGYLLWRWDGTYGTFVDGRTELFGDEAVLQTLRIAGARGDWTSALEDHRVDYVLAASGSPLDVAMRSSHQALHRDQVAALYRWTDGRSQRTP